MLETIRNSAASRAARILLLGTALLTLASCATKQEPELVSSGTGRESALPWNEQKSWENQGQFGVMAEQMQQGGSRR
jgi:outer membrane biogenesis lipoprotein LolB